MSVERSLGSLALIWDIIPTRGRPKMHRQEGDGLPEAGTREFDLMLATLVFDLVRKSVYTHRALRAFALNADPELTNRVLGELEGMRDMEDAQDYEALADRTHDLMVQAVAETEADHQLILEVVRSWSEGRAHAAE